MVGQYDRNSDALPNEVTGLALNNLFNFNLIDSRGQRLLDDNKQLLVEWSSYRQLKYERLVVEAEGLTGRENCTMDKSSLHALHFWTWHGGVSSDNNSHRILLCELPSFTGCRLWNCVCVCVYTVPWEWRTARSDKAVWVMWYLSSLAVVPRRLWGQLQSPELSGNVYISCRRWHVFMKLLTKR